MKIFRLCILLAPILLIGGCTSMRQCGDARATHQDEAYFPWEIGRMAGTVVTLPAVSLARAGTTEFHVGPLPPGSYEYTLEFAGGPLYHDAPMGGHLRLTHITVSITNSDGKLLFQKEHAVGEIKVGRSGFSAISHDFFPFYKSDDPLAHALDFRARITVTQPAAAPKATVRITGFGAEL